MVIDEALFAKINEKTREIREIATLARMGTDEEQRIGLDEVLTKVNDLTRLQNEAQLMIQKTKSM